MEEETIKLKCEKCGCYYEKPSVFKEYLITTKYNVFYKWSLAFCDKCRREKERESLESLPDVLRELKMKDKLTTSADTEQVAPPDAYTLLPAVLLDDEGYPTEEWLQYIKTYRPDESLPLITFVEMVLIDGWYMSYWGFKLHKKYKGKRKLELHTGGWSGNEETIEAIKSNMWLTHFQMRYVMWRTGGHYYFELSVS